MITSKKMIFLQQSMPTGPMWELTAIAGTSIEQL